MSATTTKRRPVAARPPFSARPPVYNYTECGLANVWLYGIEIVTDDAGEAVLTIPNLPGLHREIARCLVFDQTGLSGAELRFLRTEMGWTQEELAERLHAKPLTVSRWERDKNPIDANAITVIRALAVEKLGLGPLKDVEAMAARSGPASVPAAKVRVDASDTARYRAALEAA